VVEWRHKSMIRSQSPPSTQEPRNQGSQGAIRVESDVLPQHDRRMSWSLPKHEHFIFGEGSSVVDERPGAFAVVFFPDRKPIGAWWVPGIGFSRRPNEAVQPTGASRFAQRQVGCFGWSCGLGPCLASCCCCLKHERLSRCFLQASFESTPGNAICWRGLRSSQSSPAGYSSTPQSLSSHSAMEEPKRSANEQR
jgi:hypothetical protein